MSLKRVWHWPEKISLKGDISQQLHCRFHCSFNTFLHLGPFMHAPFLHFTRTSTLSSTINGLAWLWHNLHFCLCDVLQPYITKKCPRQKKMKTNCIVVEWEKQRGTQSFQGLPVWGRNNMCAWVNPTPTEEKASVFNLWSIIVKHGAAQKGK